MTLAELDFGEAVLLGFLNAAFTALLVAGVAAFVVKRYEALAEDRRQEAEARHAEQLQTKELEHQTRAALRETYAHFLVAQRRSREISVALARAGGASQDRGLETEAVLAHDEFVDLYHQLNLDASRTMWKDARGLRGVLDDMLSQARNGDATSCEALANSPARHARTSRAASVLGSSTSRCKRGRT
jgi:hypothetical protein